MLGRGIDRGCCLGRKSSRCAFGAWFETRLKKALLTMTSFGAAHPSSHPEEALLGRLEGRSDGAASALPYLTVTLVSFSSEFRVIMVL